MQEMKQIGGLALYQTRSCAYCIRVQRYLDDSGIEIEVRDVSAEPSYYEEMIGATGRTMVPCLRIENDDGEVEWMHESADIIVYLQQRIAT